MLKVYRTRWTLNLDGAIEKDWCYWSDPYFKYEDDIEAKTTLNGKSFQSFWDLMYEYGLVIPANRWKRGIFSKKRRIEFICGYAKTWIDDGSEREWTLETEIVEIHPKMSELMKMDAELFIEYLKERGINKI